MTSHLARSKPTDDDILKAVSKFSRQCPTYVIRNILAMAGFREVKTPWVLRQMKRLERRMTLAPPPPVSAPPHSSEMVGEG